MALDFHYLCPFPIRKRMTAIIILNWNGYQDTIACIESLMAMGRQDFLWMVVDNGSANDSVFQIQSFLENRRIPYVSCKEGDALTSALQAGTGVVYALTENYGFAKGNNLGIDLVEQSVKEFGPESFFPEYYLLLNSDTEVEPDFLSKLEDFAQGHPEYVALTPQIRYMEPRDLVWNCGGRLLFGQRMYNYDRKPVADIKEKGYIPVGFLTGCALFARRGLLGNPDAVLRRYSCADVSALQRPRLLTERFFFGEEDFDFSLSRQGLKQKMACVLDSVIYHKAGASRKDFDHLGHCYLYYLNRFIDVRQHWGRFKFLVWRILYVPYVAYILRGHAADWKTVFRCLRQLRKESAGLEEVDRNCFFSCIGKQWA